MTEISRHIESQEKFHHLFVGVSGAVLAAAIQTVKFENLGRYGIFFEIFGWILLSGSFLIALFNTWKIQQLFYGSLQAEKAGERLNVASESGTAIFLGNQFRSFVEQLENLGKAFSQRVKWQFVFFVLGIISIGFSRSIVGIMRFKAIHQTRITSGSTRTPPALPSAPSHFPASSALFSASAQAWPVSRFR